MQRKLFIRVLVLFLGVGACIAVGGSLLYGRDWWNLYRIRTAEFRTGRPMEDVGTPSLCIYGVGDWAVLEMWNFRLAISNQRLESEASWCGNQMRTTEWISHGRLVFASKLDANSSMKCVFCAQEFFVTDSGIRIFQHELNRDFPRKIIVIIDGSEHRVIDS